MVGAGEGKQPSGVLPLSGLEARRHAFITATFITAKLCHRRLRAGVGCRRDCTGHRCRGSAEHDRNPPAGPRCHRPRGTRTALSASVEDSVARTVTRIVLADTGISRGHAPYPRPGIPYSTAGRRTSVPSAPAPFVEQCRLGANAQYREVLGEHVTAAVIGFPAAMSLLDARLRGSPARSGCPHS